MIKIGILGAIGSGKSYVARNFGHPVFNADDEVSKLYKKDKKTFYKLKKKLPKYICSFPINKNQVSKAIIANKSNLKKIIKVVHQEIRRKLKLFIKKNKEKKIIIFSPAAASFDQFENFEKRGSYFNSTIKQTKFINTLNV